MPLVALRLLLCHWGQETMTVERVWAAVLGMTMLFAVSTVWTKPSAMPTVPTLGVPAAHTTAVTDSAPRALPTREDDALPTPDEDWAEPHVDLNGNEIDDAVSDYRVDQRGEMYERHAPDTALLHLSAPKL
jgi:hypothetical protein